jgi:hypothetical protein
MSGLRLLPCLSLVLLVFVGCTGSGVSGLVPVSGRVFMDRKPLAGATVRFIPEKNQTDPKAYPASEGFTDAEGNFKLSVANTEGALPGSHRVEINLFERKPRVVKGKALAGFELVPSKYNTQSELKFTVPADGTKEANFLDLHSESGIGEK